MERERGAAAFVVRAELPIELARQVFGVSLEFSRIEKDTGATVTLQRLAAVNNGNITADKPLLLLTLTGAVDAVRLAQRVVENRARRSLRRMATIRDQNFPLPATAASRESRPKSKKLCYTREELLDCLKSPDSWKRPQGLPNLPFVRVLIE